METLPSYESTGSSRYRLALPSRIPTVLHCNESLSYEAKSQFPERPRPRPSPGYTDRILYLAIADTLSNQHNICRELFFHQSTHVFPHPTQIRHKVVLDEHAYRPPPVTFPSLNLLVNGAIWSRKDNACGLSSAFSPRCQCPKCMAGAKINDRYLLLWN